LEELSQISGEEKPITSVKKAPRISRGNTSTFAPTSNDFNKIESLWNKIKINVLVIWNLEAGTGVSIDRAILHY
jgi:hypothetical protein